MELNKNPLLGVGLDELNQENEMLHSDLYQMARRYCGLRKLVDMLERDYKGVKHYPFFLRYAMLKGMLLDLKRNPAFIEVRNVSFAHKIYFYNSMH